MEDQGAGAQMPTKLEMSEMFIRMENSIKTENPTLRADLGQLLMQVEDTEGRADKQAQEIKKRVKTTSQRFANRSKENAL